MTRLQMTLFLAHLAVVTAIAVALAGWWMLPVMVLFAACIFGAALGLPRRRSRGDAPKQDRSPSRGRRGRDMRGHAMEAASEDG